MPPSSATRITVRNIPHSLTRSAFDEEINKVMAKLLSNNNNTSSSSNNNKQLAGSITVQWFQPGEAPSKYLQQQQASGSKKVLGPMPGWATLACADRRAAEAAAAHFDGRAVMPTDFPNQLASVEYPLLQMLPVNARRAMPVADVSSAKEAAGSIFEDESFLSFKKTIEEEAAAPIPCSQDQAFEFLNKWLTNGAAAENMDGEGGGGEATADDIAAAVHRRKKLTFLEKVRIRYDSAGQQGGRSSVARERRELSTTSGAARKRRQRERAEAEAAASSSTKSRRRERGRKSTSSSSPTGEDGDKKKRKRGGKRERARRERQEARDAVERKSKAAAEAQKSSELTRKKAVRDKDAFPTLAGSSPAAAPTAPTAASGASSGGRGGDKTKKSVTEVVAAKNNFTVSSTSSPMRKKQHTDPASSSPASGVSAPAPKSGGKKIMMMRRPAAPTAPQQ